MRWERSRTCPATTRQGGASACPTWWGMTATSVRPSTGRWGAAEAAGPVAATRTAPAAPTATRYCPAHPAHPQGRFSIFQQYFFSFLYILSYMHLQACSLVFLSQLCKRCCEGLPGQLSCTAESATANGAVSPLGSTMPGIAQSIKTTCWVVPLSCPIRGSLHKRAVRYQACPALIYFSCFLENTMTGCSGK